MEGNHCRILCDRVTAKHHRVSGEKAKKTDADKGPRNSFRVGAVIVLKVVKLKQLESQKRTNLGFYSTPEKITNEKISSPPRFKVKAPTHTTKDGPARTRNGAI